MTNSNDVLKIDTPENVSFDYDVAGIGSRFLAALIDTALIILLQAILYLSFFLLAKFVLNADILNGNFAGWGLAIVGVVSFIFLWGYYIFFEILWNGQSPGKRLFGIRVIRVDGTPITVSESIIRNLVRLIDLLPTAYGVGVVTMFINHNSRRVGDLAAGTIVIHDRQIDDLLYFSQLRPGIVSTLASIKDIPEGFPVERVSQNELQIIEEFLARRQNLSNRLALARHILASIVGRLEIPHESIPYNKAEQILASIYQMRQTEKAE